MNQRGQIFTVNSIHTSTFRYFGILKFGIDQKSDKNGARVSNRQFISIFRNSVLCTRSTFKIQNYQCYTDPQYCTLQLYCKYASMILHLSKQIGACRDGSGQESLVRVCSCSKLWFNSVCSSTPKPSSDSRCI